MRPSHWSSTSIILNATPEWNITDPMRMNMGSGTSTNVETELSMLRISWLSPMAPPQNT